ncbi:MAG: metalloregulator ArsR/SmtB family transcription factor [Caldilineaceae bacterium]
MFSALADPTRRSILEMLANQGELSATEISDAFSVTPQAISQHLKVLRQAELVLVEKRAQQRIYRINPQTMLEVEDWATRLRQLWEARFDALDRVLQAEQSAEQALPEQASAEQSKEKNDGQE